MILAFSKEAWSHYLYWQQEDKQVLKRLNRLLEDVKRSPFTGIGDPEALSYNLSGYWSRRINEEHRLVYRVIEETVYIESCRYHYSLN